MKFKIFIIYFLISGFCFSQNVFKNIYSRGLFGKLYQTQSNDFLLIQGGGIMRLNGSGSIKFNKDYSTLHFTVTDLLKRNDNDIVLSGDARDTCAAFPTAPFIQPALIAIDSLGMVLWSKYYKINGACGAVSNFTYLKRDGGILMSGGNAGSPQFVGPNGFILNTDASGNVLWAKHFNQDNGGCQFISEFDDKSIVAGLNIENGGGVILRLDSSGNILWCKSFIRPKGYIHSILLDTDGNFLITGNTDSLNLELGEQFPPWFHPYFFVMKMDSIGQIIWAKQYDDSTGVQNFFTLDPSSIIKLGDGNYLVYSGKYGQTGQKLVLMKLDSNGNIISSFAHGPSGFLNQPQSILQTFDGGFLMSEGTWGNYPNGWIRAFELIKTDSLGQSVGCFEHQVNINVYPYFPSDSILNILHLDGAIGYSLNVVDTSYGPAGIYDECVLLNSGQQFPKKKTQEIIIYPNPVTDVLRVSLPESSETSLLEIFDAFGKRVFERCVPTGISAIDLNFNEIILMSGVYQIRIVNEKSFSVLQFIKN